MGLASLLQGSFLALALFGLAFLLLPFEAIVPVALGKVAEALQDLRDALFYRVLHAVAPALAAGEVGGGIEAYHAEFPGGDALLSGWALPRIPRVTSAAGRIADSARSTSRIWPVL